MNWMLKGRGKYGERKAKGGNQMATNKQKQKATKNYLMVQNKVAKKSNRLTIGQKKRGTGFQGRLKIKGKKTQLGKKASMMRKKARKTRGARPAMRYPATELAAVVKQ